MEMAMLSTLSENVPMPSLRRPGNETETWVTTIDAADTCVH